MKPLIFSDTESCVGCNRCTRSCPIETANVTFIDKNGNVKVDIDHDKCIACGACITVCKHKARNYSDDTQAFINDLKQGLSISLIIAPAIRSNTEETGRLLTWLRSLGVEKIYDVSLGADICTWAHIRYIQQNHAKALITQPCPVIVNYCLMYHPKLIKNLSPVHSPMLCTAAYMKHYEKITSRIAAISPCIAKSHEFESTGLVHYNVTFKKLFQYISDNNITLPKEPSTFDHYLSGLGCVYSMPGGLKENVEFFLGKTLRIDKSEGQSTVYKTLNDFEKQPADNLPDIFDVLNCAEGCNAGTGCIHNRDIFELNTAMDITRRKSLKGRDRTYFDNLYEQYDKTLNMQHFIRTYVPTPVHILDITQSDIENALLSMGKDNDIKRNFDCGACGSDTCTEMARKIALHVNIPDNCIQKTRDEIKSEHATLTTVQQENIKNIMQILTDVDSIKEYTDKIATHINKVNASVDEYNTMAKTINDIAMQIGIISMNASIEATRAGSYGKAFSVIAGEIHTLSTNSRDAVSKSDNASVNVGESVHEMNEIIEKILSSVKTAHTHIQKINDSQSH